MSWHHIRRTMADVLRFPELVPPLRNEHVAMAGARLAREAEAAALMEDHIDNAFGRLGGPHGAPDPASEA